MGVGLPFGVFCPLAGLPPPPPPPEGRSGHATAVPLASRKSIQGRVDNLAVMECTCCCPDSRTEILRGGTMQPVHNLRAAGLPIQAPGFHAHHRCVSIAR
jgi:hypothetical protein